MGHLGDRLPTALPPLDPNRAFAKQLAANSIAEATPRAGSRRCTPQPKRAP